MRFGDVSNVLFVIRVCKALVVDDNIKTLEPFRVLVQFDHGLCPLSPLVDDRPVDWNAFFLGRKLHGFALKIIVVTAATCYQQDRKVFLRRLGRGIDFGLLGRSQTGQRQGKDSYEEYRSDGGRDEAHLAGHILILRENRRANLQANIVRCEA